MPDRRDVRGCSRRHYFGLMRGGEAFHLMCRVQLCVCRVIANRSLTVAAPTDVPPVSQRLINSPLKTDHRARNVTKL